jgi:hypothetical protein
MRIEGQDYLSASRRSSTLGALCAFVALLAGCASPTTYEGMVPTTFETARQHQKSASVGVTGGQETEATGKPQISNATFTQALVESITKSKVFSRVVQDKGVDYQLTVTLFSMEQPSFGLSFTVKMEAGWTLKRVDTGATVWQKAIRSEYTASTSEAFAAVVRLRLATEGAARQNISQGISEISKLDL